MPYVAQVAVGRREYLNVLGSDYLTHDGTGVRDYIHAVDLALGHLKALQRLDNPQCIAVNLGTGVGYSVLDVVQAFLAEHLLRWKAERDLAAMCKDHWRWQKKLTRLGMNSLVFWCTDGVR